MVKITKNLSGFWGRFDSSDKNQYNAYLKDFCEIISNGNKNVEKIAKELFGFVEYDQDKREVLTYLVDELRFRGENFAEFIQHNYSDEKASVIAFKLITSLSEWYYHQKVDVFHNPPKLVEAVYVQGQDDGISRETFEKKIYSDEDKRLAGLSEREIAFERVSAGDMEARYIIELLYCELKGTKNEDVLNAFLNPNPIMCGSTLSILFNHSSKGNIKKFVKLVRQEMEQAQKDNKILI
ncbi:MAG: hypothetical protein IJ538_00600 [Clostridia bacterium]|nr:hypothetical protein [Clostridia bacterium]